MGLLDQRFITLKAGILAKHRLAWIGDLRFIGHLFVMRFASMRWAEITHALRPPGHDDKVFVAMNLLFATVVQGLFFSVFRPLASSLRTIQDIVGWLTLATLGL